MAHEILVCPTWRIVIPITNSQFLVFCVFKEFLHFIQIIWLLLVFPYNLFFCKVSTNIPSFVPDFRNFSHYSFVLVNLKFCQFCWSFQRANFRFCRFSLLFLYSHTGSEALNFSYSRKPNIHITLCIAL